MLNTKIVQNEADHCVILVPFQITWNIIIPSRVTMETDDLNQIQKQLNAKEESETVKVEKLPQKQFAKLLTSPKKETLVERFEGFFYW